MALDEQALLAAAIAQVPDAEFDGDEFREGLRVLITAINEEADLTPVGEMASVPRLVMSLAKRRRLWQLLQRRPEIRETPIVAPIFVLGFPRTGTTLLHNLLASDARNRSLQLWEMREPYPPDPAPPNWQASTIATTEQLVAFAYAMCPRLSVIHPLRATWPDEDSWMFRSNFTSLVYAFNYHVPSYLDWQLGRDARPDYAYFRLQLQGIVAQRPGAPLVLKDPCHLWQLDALLEAFPDARIIQLHRRIEDVVASFCSLLHALGEGLARPRPLAELGRYASGMLERGMQRMLAVRAGLAEGRIVDVDYRELVGDPVGMVAKLYERLGLELDEIARSSMAAWLDDNRELTGRHGYSLATYGLDEADIAHRFAAYHARFENFLPP